MTYSIKQSTTAYPLIFFMTDSADHVTGKTGLSPTVTIRKVGGSFASPAGSVTEIASGWYQVAGNATDSDTLGPLLLHATGTGADPTDTYFEVVAFDPQDTVRLGLTALPNAAAQAAGGLYTRGTGAGQINQDANGRVDVNIRAISEDSTAPDNLEAMYDGNGYAGGTTKLDVNLVQWKATAPADLISQRVDTTVGAMQTGVITATATAADCIDASALATDAVAEIVAAVWAKVVETNGSITAQQAASIILAATAGVTSSGGSVLKDPSGTSTRITATVDGSNNRTAMSLAPSA
jgi:hypothetical protein